MSICQKCAGDGLVGNGPSPHLKEGHITTCPDCLGTGQIQDAPVQKSENVDNQPEQEKKTGGILGIFRR